MTEQEHIRYRELMNKPMALLTDADLVELRVLAQSYEDLVTDSNHEQSLDEDWLEH